MAHESGLKDASSIQVNCDSSDSTFEINITTLDLETYSFRVTKNMPVSALKEAIVTKIGMPLEQQRLLFRGKILKDAQLLSELRLEDGDTMHLLERQPVQSRPTSSTFAGEISGTSSSQGAEAESSQNTRRIQTENSANRDFIYLNYPLPSSEFSHMPTLQTLIPDSLTTLTEYINLMEGLLLNSSNSLNNGQHQPRLASLSLDARGIPTPEYLGYVLDRTQELLRDNATTAISHLSALLIRVDSYSNPLVRGQIQSEAMHLSVAMHHLGAMLLELGRATMYLNIGRTPEESFVYAGPAVYISPIGPNPILVQPSHFQSSSLSCYNPAHIRIQQSVPVRSAPRVFGSTISRGGQRDEPTSIPQPPSGSDSILTPVGQDTADIPNVPSRNAQVQSSSNATQGFHAVVSSGTQSDMSNVLGSDSRFQNPLSRPETSEVSSNREVNELLDLKDLVLGMSNDGTNGHSENVVGAEDSKQSGSGENHVSGLTDSGKVEQQVDLGQALERIEQNGDPRSIFGALLEISVRLYGEQNVYQDIVELGNNEELANEFMEVLKRDIHRRLAKESSLKDKS